MQLSVDEIERRELDWRELASDSLQPALGSRPKHRLRWLLVAYSVALALILTRAILLQARHGEAFRQAAHAPRVEMEPIAAERGRITDRFGEVLALDYQAKSLAVHYRYLQSPLDPRWLHRQAVARLPRAKRHDAAALNGAVDEVRAEIGELHKRLAAACGLGIENWQRRTAHIQRRVERMAVTVNQRRQQRFAEQTSTVPDEQELSFHAVLAGLFAPPAALPPADIAIAEQVTYHRVVDQISPDIARRIESSPATFPGVRIVPYTRRHYPRELLASNLIGHVGTLAAAQATSVAGAPDNSATAVQGLMGIEKQFDGRLSGTPGSLRRLSNRRGELIETTIERRARVGSDVVLTIDAELQASAEQLLERFDRRLYSAVEDAEAPRGGAVLVMDVHSGEVLASASQPRFDPNWFATGDPQVEAVLSDPRQPLFDRALRMELPPGSVFKPLVAIALLEHGIVRADTTFRCQGYLNEPDRMRCQLFRQHGIGHGELDLAGALAQSCNVYFFQHATRLGAEPLVAWARRFGFGVGGGHLPLPSELRSGDSIQTLAIGQETLTATPLQVLRLYAAIANGGELLEPRFTRSQTIATKQDSTPQASTRAPSRIAGLDAETLAAVRRGLEMVVADPTGTAFQTVRTPAISVAGKTGTAQSGGKQPDHAWFAGYVPADEPRYAFVVVLEHGGSGSTAAGAIARRLIERLSQLGYLDRGAAVPGEAFPPGKG